MTRFWPFAPNWRNSVNVNYEFRTTTLTSRGKREQRIALRDEPRMSFNFLTTVHRDAFQALVREVTQGLSGDWWVMDPTKTIKSHGGVVSVPNSVFGAAEPVLVDGGSVVTDNDTVLTNPSYSKAIVLLKKDLPLDWLFPADKVCLWANGRMEMRTVHSVYDMNGALFADRESRIYVDSVPITGKSEVVFVRFVEDVDFYPAGTRVGFIRRGWIAPTSTLTMPVNNLAEITVTFNVMPGSEPDQTIESPTTVFNGREIFLKRPNWQETPQDTMEAFREIVDYGKGRIGSFSMADFLPVTRRFTYLGKSRAELESIRQFFLRMTGQQGEFYMPTWTDDITPKIALVSGQNTLWVAGTAFHDAYAEDTIHKALVVVRTNGDMLCRTITSMATNSGDSVLTLGANWPEDIPLTDIVSVCWLPVWRLMSDTLSVEWLTDEKGQTVLTMKMLEDLPGE